MKTPNQIFPQKPYRVIDLQTSTVVSRFQSRPQASIMAQSLDAAYGAVRYTVKGPSEYFFMLRNRLEEVLSQYE